VILKKIVGIVLSTFLLFASEDTIDKMIAEQSMKKSFLIIHASKSYSDAYRFMQQFSKKSGIVVDLKGVLYQEDIGLTPPKELCLEQGFSYPCYVPRGGYDDGVYLSIERSESYNGFREGYYIVIAASGTIEPKVVQRVKKIVPKSYVKQSLVYMGCYH